MRCGLHIVEVILRMELEVWRDIKDPDNGGVAQRTDGLKGIPKKIFQSKLMIKVARVRTSSVYRALCPLKLFVALSVIASYPPPPRHPPPPGIPS
jgi:hypothetical protein